MFAGIDYSISSPAICVHPDQEKWDPTACRFLYFSKLKKVKDGDTIENVFEVAKLIDTKEERVFRYGSNANKCLDFLTKHGVDSVSIEGYAFAARSSMAMQMGENGGILRYVITHSGMEYIEVPPLKIKKFATDKGRSDKIAMVSQFEKETGYDMKSLFNKKVITNPLDDIADAYFICKHLHKEKINERFYATLK